MFSLEGKQSLDQQLRTKEFFVVRCVVLMIGGLTENSGLGSRRYVRWRFNLRLSEKVLSTFSANDAKSGATRRIYQFRAAGRAKQT